MTSLPSRSASPPRVGDEVERVELDQQVVAEEAVDVEAAGLGIELDPRAGSARCST